MLTSNSIIVLLTAAIASFVAVKWVYFKVLRIAKLKGLVDNPDARKLQKIPIPVMGGIAVFFGLVSGLIVASSISSAIGLSPLRDLLPIVGVMCVMLYTGAMDDIMGLSPLSRLIIEVLSIVVLILSTGNCIDSFHGMWCISHFSWWVAVPFTIFAGVGIINAVNMIDGVNGLSSGLCMFWCACFGLMFALIGDLTNAVLAVAVIFAIIPFYLHNVFGLHSRMFIGDAGTMVIGILMTWFTICVLKDSNEVCTMFVGHNFNLIAFSLAVLSVPVFDTLRVMTMRILKKQSPFHPDKTHLHHVFVNIGISHFITSVCIQFINVLNVVMWFVMVKNGLSIEWQFIGVIITSMLLVWGAYVFLRYHVKNHTRLLHRLTHFSVSTHLGRKDWWKRFTAWLDAPELSQAEEMVEMQKNQAKRRSNRFEHIADDDYKEQDRKRLLDYLRGKAEVHVKDIETYSGVDKLRLYTLLFEEEQEGYIEVVKRSGWGAPEIVYLIE